MSRELSDVLVIGAGAAGLSLALRLADRHKVSIIAKGPFTEGASLYAQGGIAAVLADDDSVSEHVNDTLVAGSGLCDPKAVEFTVEHGRNNIKWLIEQGVEFTAQQGSVIPDAPSEYHLTREGGHGHRRIIHKADKTGKAVVTTLSEKAKKHPNIRIFDYHLAIDLITSNKIGHNRKNQCFGAYIFNKRENRVEVFQAAKTVLACGGAGKVYLYTSNPDVASGDGVAMAWRAGCRTANMEFIQFHPTCLFHPDAKSQLISEALRGEGATLQLPDGTEFMHNYHPQADLAPRDVVARAIDAEMKRLGIDCVYLDATHMSKGFLQEHFPRAYKNCRKFGIKIEKQRIPIVPAAHYMCGGILTDLDGKTDVDGLYAIGETSYTGLHGANRLASNSLLECLVFGESAAASIDRSLTHNDFKSFEIPDWDESRVCDSDEEVVVSHNWHELRQFMWDYVGIVRTDKRLQRAKRRVELLKHEINEYYANFRVTNDLIELRNLVLISELIITSAMLRKESRGLHYSLDYPQANESATPQPTILHPDQVPEAYHRK